LKVKEGVIIIFETHILPCFYRGEELQSYTPLLTRVMDPREIVGSE
jgi:hypothetical protein